MNRHLAGKILTHIGGGLAVNHAHLFQERHETDQIFLVFTAFGMEDDPTGVIEGINRGQEFSGVIAARRAGYRSLIFPEANRKDFEELPEYLRKGLQVHFAGKYEEVCEIALGR